jgi:hypothetical protein
MGIWEKGGNVSTQTLQKTVPNVLIAESLAKRMNVPTVQDRIGLAMKGLALLKEVPITNGEYKQVAMAAGKLADSLKKEYQNPQTRIKAAKVATELKSFAREITPFGSAKIEIIDTLCLA